MAKVICTDSIKAGFAIIDTLITEIASIDKMFTDGIFSADVTEGQFKKVVTDSITTEVICADTVKTNTFCSFSTFEVKNAFGEPVFTIEPNAGFDYAFNLVGNVMI